MTTGDAAPTPDPSPRPAVPTPADVLRWCAAAAPAPWFPSDHAREAGVPRDSLDEPLWALRQAGLVHVADWVRGRGQGFALTPAGREAVADPRRLSGAPPEPPPAPPAPPPPETPRTKVRAPADDLLMTTYDRGEAARAAFFTPRPAVVAPALIAANVVWFLVGLAVAQRGGVDVREYLRGENVVAVLRQGAVFGPHLLDGEWWRLASSMFAHFGLMHLALNTVAVAVLGPLAEGLWGRGRFAVVYVAAGVGGACAAAANGPLTVVAGASGAVWGVMFSVVAWLLLYREHLPPQAAVGWGRQLLYAVTLNAAISLLPGVSWEAHVGGGVVGCATAVLVDLTRPGRGWRRPAVGAVGLVVLAAAVGGGLLAAVRYTDKWRLARGLGEIVRLAPGATPQLKVLPAEYGPGQVHAVHGSATAALVTRQAGALQIAREMTDNLDRLAEALSQLATDGGRAYVAEVRQYVALLRPLLAAGEAPTAEQGRALRDQLQRVEDAWAAAQPR